MLSAFHNVESLRTFVFLRNYPYLVKARKLPSHLCFHSLCAFSAKRSTLTSISFLISNSKHLRYLNLLYTNTRILPDTICSLQSLQTLDVSFCDHVHKLPRHKKSSSSLYQRLSFATSNASQHGTTSLCKNLKHFYCG